ncbi:MAG: glycosyltransferase [Desulfobacteraceae bacterium]|nr:glycosyltransferase [Desulfobacteraceae bacterium]
MKRPELLIVQNPSVVLAFFASILKYPLKYKLIVDRHTNFRLGKSIGLNPLIIIITFFSNFSLKHADLTIVTNDYLKKLVKKKGGSAHVLKDKIPILNPKQELNLQGVFNVVVTCSYSKDEPIEQVIKVGQYLDNSTYIYITGRYGNKLKNILIPDNVIPTGFLPENTYVDLLNSAQIIMDLTSNEWCLVCGGYEAMALGKAFITSNTVALRNLYKDAAIYVIHDSKDISEKIKFTIENRYQYEKRMLNLKNDFIKEWNKEFEGLKRKIRLLY